MEVLYGSDCRAICKQPVFLVLYFSCIKNNDLRWRNESDVTQALNKAHSLSIWEYFIWKKKYVNLAYYHVSAVGIIVHNWIIRKELKVWADFFFPCGWSIVLKAA